MAKRTRTTKKEPETEPLFRMYPVPSTGREIRLVPVAYYKLQRIGEQLRQEYLERGEPLDPPTFEVEVAGGDMQPHEHYHETTIAEDPETGKVKEVIVRSSLKTDEDHAAWAAYLDANRRLANDAMEPGLRFLLRNGVDVDPDKDPDWEEDQKFDGFIVPEDPREKKIHYILSEVLLTAEEQKEASEIIMFLSVAGRDKKTEAAFRKLFRDSMEENEEGPGDAAQ